MKRVRNKFTPLRRGLLELAVYKIISKREVYAEEIFAALKGTELEAPKGTLYPILSEMERNRGVGCRWAQLSAAPPRKYYRITAGGRAQLEELEAYWEHLSDLINTIQ